VLAEERPTYFLGLISGTSADGIDAALVDFSAALPRPIAARVVPYPAALRARIVELSQRDQRISLDEMGALDHAIGAAFAYAASEVLSVAGLTGAAVIGAVVIGSHGQTLRHRPLGDTPFTLQLGDPSLIAERTGCTVVADFRRRDVAAGGQGAPLMPAFHAAVLGSESEPRAVLNLGGIANLTLLTPVAAVRGFDTGPANGLLDAWCLRHTGAAYDHAGALAVSGSTSSVLLARLLGESWLALPPPKSTGRDIFHLDWLAAHIDGLTLSVADVQATLLAFTVQSIADALRREQPDCRRLIACGGGVHNDALLRALSCELPMLTVESSAAHGIDPDFVEAMGFAWLARETLAGRPGNLASVTGARGPRVLGAIYPAG